MMTDMQRWSFRLLLACAAFAVGCDLCVVPNRDSVPEGSSIRGTVTSEGVLHGDVFLMLYSCDEPPPPEGAGRPIDFVVIPQADFDDDEAPFVFPLVAAGASATADTAADSACYLIVGFADSDHDFNPFFGVTGQVTAGDYVSSAVVVMVPGAPSENEPIPLVENVQVEIDTVVPLDRPSFEVQVTHASTLIDPCGTALEEGTPLSLNLGKDTDFLLDYDLLCAAVDALPVSSSLVDVEQPLFTLVFAPDGDSDGLPDDINGDTMPDVLWPKVVFYKLDPADSSMLTTTEPPLVIPGVVLPQNPDGDPAYDHLTNYLMAGMPLDGETAYPVDHLDLVIPEVLLMDADAVPPATELLENVAATGLELAGAYQVLIMNSTGQLWSTPNELIAYGTEKQDQVLIVTEE